MIILVCFLLLLLLLLFILISSFTSKAIRSSSPSPCLCDKNGGCTPSAAAAAAAMTLPAVPLVVVVCMDICGLCFTAAVVLLYPLLSLPLPTANVRESEPSAAVALPRLFLLEEEQRGPLLITRVGAVRVVVVVVTVVVVPLLLLLFPSLIYLEAHASMVSQSVAVVVVVVQGEGLVGQRPAPAVLVQPAVVCGDHHAPWQTSRGTTRQKLQQRAESHAVCTACAPSVNSNSYVWKWDKWTLLVIPVIILQLLGISSWKHPAHFCESLSCKSSHETETPPPPLEQQAKTCLFKVVRWNHCCCCKGMCSPVDWPLHCGLLLLLPCSRLSTVNV